jgi:CubicO group peptidase (beta-lactamase class C family)
MIPTHLSLPGIENYVEKTLHSWNIPGASLLIWKDGETLLERGFGVRELGQPGPMEAKTIFNIASSTKAFTAACLGLLVDEGRLAWDDPVVKFLPEFRVYDPWITSALTLRDLLNHRLGLRRYNRVSLRNDPFDLDEFLQHFPYMEPAAPFRTRFCYGNEQYLLSSKVLEVVSGKSYETCLQERLLTPLGMTSTYPTLARLRASGEDNISHGHANLEGGFIPAGARLLDPVQALPLIDIGRNAAGGIWSNLPDLARWLEFLLGQGTFRGQDLIRRDVMQEMSTPQVAIAPRDEDLTTIFEAVGLQVNILTYAFGWYVMEFHGRKLVVHGGNFLNGNNVIGYLPGENLGFVLFVNTYHVIAHVLLSFHLLDAWFGRSIDYSRRGLEAARLWQAGASQAVGSLLAGRRLDTRPTFPLERYAGVYNSPLLGEVRIAWQGEELHFSYGSRHFYDGKLEHWQEDTFVVNYRNRYTDPEFIAFETGMGSRASALVWLDSGFQPIGRMNAEGRSDPGTDPGGPLG